MNKFHKTSYSRQPNYNNFLQSAGGDREKPLIGKNEIRTSSIRRKEVEDMHPLPSKNLNEDRTLYKQIESKIEIDSSLLFNVKKNASKNPTVTKAPIRKSANKTEIKIYQGAESNFYKERPQSKQESRIKVNLKDGSKRSNDYLPQRPHTSKGVRTNQNKFGETLMGSRRMSIENMEDSSGAMGANSSLIDRKSMVASSQSRRPSSKGIKHSHNTSIDPEFLALFAN